MSLIIKLEFIMKTVLIGLFLVVTLNAQDRIFNYTYQSTVLGVGQREIEPWSTFKWGKKNFFREFDHRIEFELGMAKNLQTAFYLNLKTSASQANDSTINTDNEISFSNEWKYKISDPVADRIGFALYEEIGIGRNEIELESKLIFDKRIGPSTVALNVVGEFDFENEAENGKVELERETTFEFDFGYSYNVSRNWFLGFEARNTNEIKGSKWVNSALFGGPTLSYTTENFWVNLTILPQIKGLKGATHGGLVLGDHERLETRLIFSYSF